jgi:hypothetical protein
MPYYTGMENDTTVIEETTEAADRDAAFAPDAINADPSFWQGYEEWLDDCRRNELAAAG